MRSASPPISTDPTCSEMHVGYGYVYGGFSDVALHLVVVGVVVVPGAVAAPMLHLVGRLEGAPPDPDAPA